MQNDLRPGESKTIRSLNKTLTSTSENFQHLRKEIEAVYLKRRELQTQLNSKEINHAFFVFFHLLSYPLIFGFFYKGIKEKKDELKKLVEDLKAALEKTFVEITYDDPQIEKRWLDCIDTHTALMQSEKIWDITYQEGVDRVKERTIAQNSIKRKKLSYQPHSLEFIHSQLPPLYFPNGNGPGVYVYPTFLIIFLSKYQFGILGLNDVQFDFEFTSFVETERVPKDAEIIDYTWQKTNKDGSRDKRFKQNSQIPVAKYGMLHLTSSLGLDESYMFSNPGYFSQFDEKMTLHITRLKK